jgi:glycerol-3-phosphate dehydrogenase
LEQATVCVIGGGVVGVSVALALARREVDVMLVEAEPELALGASGTNSGILHTGYDARPGTLEAQMIVRSAALRQELVDVLDPPFLPAGGLLRPRDDRERATLEELEARARLHGVAVERSLDGTLFVPGEAVTDPVAFTLVIAAAAEHAGARVKCGTGIDSIERRNGELLLSAGGEPIVRCRAAVNCAGLFADEVARAAGDHSFRIVPVKGEFLVFEPPGGRSLEHILLAIPTARTKGVLVFPTTDGKVVAGPTAHDQADKRDWSVRPEAFAEVMGGAVALLSELGGLAPVASYAGLRPAGAGGVNYLIEWSDACPGLLHVAAIRSTGLSASLAIGEHVAGLIGAAGFELEPGGPLERGDAELPQEPWWRRAARRSRTANFGS